MLNGCIKNLTFYENVLFWSMHLLKKCLKKYVLLFKKDLTKIVPLSTNYFT